MRKTFRKLMVSFYTWRRRVEERRRFRRCYISSIKKGFIFEDGACKQLNLLIDCSECPYCVREGEDDDV